MKAMATVSPSDRLRLDELLVVRGLYESRSRARDAIERGTVMVGGAVAPKPGQLVEASTDISIDDPAARYVSRAALKLIAGLDHFGLDPRGPRRSTSAPRPAGSRRCCSNAAPRM